MEAWLAIMHQKHTEIKPNIKGMLIVLALNIPIATLFWFEDWGIPLTPIHGPILATFLSLLVIVIAITIVRMLVTNSKSF